MIKTEATVISERFYIDYAIRLSVTAARFKSKLNIVADGYKRDLKSHLGLISFTGHMTYGKAVTIIADGKDENEAIEAIVGLFKTCFGDKK